MVDVMGGVVKILTLAVGKHIGYAVSSTKLVDDVRTKFSILYEAYHRVRDKMKNHIMHDLEIPTFVIHWLAEVEDLKEELNYMSLPGFHFLNMKMRYRTGRKAILMAERIDKLLEIKSKFNWKPTHKSLTPIRPTFPSTERAFKRPTFPSTERAFKDAMKFLQQDDNSCQVIALLGPGGVGKTTMMNELSKVAKDRKMFDIIVKVLIGMDPNILSIQQDIAIKIGGDLYESTVEARAERLLKKFKTIIEENKRKILLIMDDVWGGFELKYIGLTSHLANGVKLLLTSRISSVCKDIAAQAGLDLKLVNVGVQELDEAYYVLSQVTGVSKEDNLELYQIGCDIISKCGGSLLPIEVLLLGKYLKNREKDVWRSVLHRLSNTFDLYERLQEILELSYNVIKDEDKEIFLLCSLFPEDFDIPIEDLTRLVWGLKLFEVYTLRKARHITIKCVQNLINANLLVGGHDLGYVKMHDIVLAFALGIVSKGNHPWVINHGHGINLSGNETEHCKRISLTCRSMSEFPTDFNYPNLSLIQLMDGDLSIKFEEDFYDHMKHLEVIAYYNMLDPLLPKSLQNLTTLCLHKCKLMSDCSFLGDLVNLEVLSLVDCGIRKLTLTIGKLIKLKLLDLTGCVDLHIDDDVFKSLINLEELYIKVSDGKAIRFTDKNSEELKMLLSNKLIALEVEFVEKKHWLKNVSFKQLEKFKISMGCLLDKEKDNDKYSIRNTMKIVTDNSSGLLDCKLDELFNKTEKLHLQVEEMTQLEDVSRGLREIQSFLNLKDLEVCNCVELRYLFPISVASGLRKLERLTVSSCFVLEALIHDNRKEINNVNEEIEFKELDNRREINNVNEEIEFKELRFMSLEKLPELVSLFPDDMVVKLPQLVELEVDGLPNFTSIYPDKNNISSLLNSKVGILELKKLSIKSMENLKQIWAVSSEEEGKLREIEVEGCDSLVNLFPTNPMGLLKHLEELTVRNCGSIEVIFNVDLDCIGHEVSNTSLSFIEVYCLKNIREVWRIKAGEYNSDRIIRFAGVERISIRGCKMFRNVFTPTDAKFYMGALSNINIYDCGEQGKNKEPEFNVITSVAASEVFEDNFNVTCSMGASEIVEDNINVASLSSIPIPSSSNYNSNLNLVNSQLKVVFEISNATTQEQPPLFPYLKNLRLSHMERMTHVWKGDYSSLILQNGSSFNNLTTIYLYQCKKIKYLFSPIMAKLLHELKQIHLDACDAMEHVVSNRDDKDEEMTTFASTSTATFFPNLHSLSFRFLRSLKGIGAGGVHDEFKVSQVSVVCSYLFSSSREIHISWCDVLSEIFETQGMNNNSVSNSRTDNDERNGGIYNKSVAFLKGQNVNVPQLSNLKKLVIAYCGLLQHVFTFSTLDSLKQLQELEIKECEAMKVIVKEENREQRKVVEFPKLKSLELSDLQNLKGFFMGTNSFKWPLLEKVMISKCPQMVVFTNGRSTASELNYIHTTLGKHSLGCGLNFNLTTDWDMTTLPSSGSRSLERLPWSFHNLIELHMPYNYDCNLNCVIPSNQLLQLQKLEMIRMDWCFHVNEVFEVETIEGKNVVIPNLRHVELSNLEDVKYIWKGEMAVLLFPNLTTLSIDHCENLEYVFTSAMVGSLQQLKDLHISTCSNMKVIITGGDDAEEKEMVSLPCLKSLKLEKLQCLERFWLGKDNNWWPSLPCLKLLEINECPQITSFPKDKRQLQH